MSGQQSTHGPELTIVVPAYNEEGQIEREIHRLHEAMAGLGVQYEVVVVDDGSQDRTAEIAEACRCTVLKQPQNRGYGAALKRGIRHANTEFVLITDADGTYPAERIPDLWAHAKLYDMVVGARIGSDVQVPWVRRPAKWFLRQLASYLSGRVIPDVNSGLRIMRRDQVARFAHILPNAFSFTTTITMALLCSDLSVKYVAIDYAKRVGRSKVTAMDAYRFLVLSLRVSLLFNPLKIFLPMGTTLFLAGSAKFAYDVTLNNLSESAVLAILGAIIVWCFGLLADQNARLGMDRDRWD